MTDETTPVTMDVPHRRVSQDGATERSAPPLSLPPIMDYPYDEELITGFLTDRRPRMQVYPFPGTAVVLGRGSDPSNELRLENCLADRVAVFRRRGGGASVVLDRGDLVVSFAAPAEGLGRTREHFRAITGWLIDGLEKLGIAGVRRRGISDIALGEGKLAGTSLYRPRGWLFFTASLLVNPELERIERYLAHPPREPDYRRGRPHREFLVTIAEITGMTDVHGFAGRLKEVLELTLTDMPLFTSTGEKAGEAPGKV